MSEKPRHLTIVATSRNDDHGGNLLQRMQLFIDGLTAQCERHGLNAELVLVEWNPPPDRPRLSEALSWPRDPAPCPVCIVEVPAEIHQRFKYSDRLPLFQMIAKNVGIRRARGRFILATNIDILFSDELVQFLASDQLLPGYLYRIDRHDVPASIPTDATIQDQLEYCRRNVLRMNGRTGTQDLSTGEFHRIYSRIPHLPQPVHALLSACLPRRVRTRWLLGEYFWYFTERARLHTNASGDFALMAKEHWFDLRGYPELEMFSLHLDSLFCYMAHHGGARELVLEEPMRIYHIEHTAGWTPEAEVNGTLRARLDSLGLPQLSFEQVDAWATQMRREDRPIIFNNEEWGLVNEDLPETLVCGEDR